MPTLISLTCRWLLAFTLLFFLAIDAPAQNQNQRAAPRIGFV